MLSSIKDKAQGPIFKSFMFLLAISFAGWGIGDFLKSTQGGDVAVTVGDTDITAQEFERAWRGQYGQLEKQVGPDVAKQIAREMQLDQRMVSSMVQDTLVQNAAKDMKLVATDPMVVGNIKSLPYFAGVDGKFDANRYQAVLNSAQLSPVQFEQMVGQNLRAEALASIFTGVSLVDQKAFERFVANMSQTRDAKVLVVTEKDVPAVAEPTEQQIKDAYVDRKEEFKTEEKRDVSVLVLDITPFMSKAHIDQAKLADAVKEASERATTDAPRHSRHILVATEAEAKDIETQLKNGADFAALAKAKSLDTGSGAKGGDLGFASRGQMVPSFEEALFNLKSGEISKPVQSDFGWHVIQLLDIKPVDQAALAKLRNEAEANLRKEAAEPEYLTMQENIDDRIAGGEILEAIAKEFNLELHRYPALPQSGNGTDVIGGQQVLAEAFRLAEGEVSNPLTLAPQKVAYVMAGNIVPSDYKPVETVSADIARSLKNAALNDSLRSFALKLADEFKAGKPLETIAAEHKLVTPVQTANNIGRKSLGSSPLIRDLTVERLFSVGNGKLLEGVQPVPGGVSLVEVVAIHQPTVGDDTRKALLQGLHNTYQEDTQKLFLEYLKAKNPVEIHQKVISRITGIERE